MPGPGVAAWCAAVAGLLAPLTIGGYVLWGGRKRRGYDPWRDTMTKLGDETDGVARWFVVVNLIVAVQLGVFGYILATELDLDPWLRGVLLGAAGNSLVIGLTGCNRRCKGPRCRPGRAPRIVPFVHGVAAFANALGIIVVPVLVSWAIRDEETGDPLRILGYVLSPIGLCLAALYVWNWIRQRKGAARSYAGLLERLLWIVGYAWVVVAATSLLDPGWPWAGIALGAWLAISVPPVVRPGWRDPSPEFVVDDCQPNTIYATRHLTCGLLLVRRIDDPSAFAAEVRRAMKPARNGDGPLLGGRVRLADAHAVVTMGVSWRGLERLGVPYRWNAPFVDDPFRLGMRERKDVLGDAGASDPGCWDDGWRQHNDLHLVFWIVGTSQLAVHRARRLVERTFFTTKPVVEQETLQPKRDGRSTEHFGFVDGVGSPWIERVPPVRPNEGGGVLTRKGKWRSVALGEFVVGHVDETNDIFPVPDPREIFEGGTFMVVRKLEQDVQAFRDFTDAIEKAADRLVGREPSGKPLMKPTDRDDDELNDFKFGEDPDGLICPRGAHIRRANPRDALGFGTTLSARRRLLRRGMPYGRPLEDETAAEQRGLLFVAYNVRISEQFEFIQSQWFNTGIAFGLGTDPDLISGQWDDERWVTLTAGDGTPVRRQAPRLITVRGGEYFFVPSLPGLRALEKLSASANRPAQAAGHPRS